MKVTIKDDKKTKTLHSMTMAHPSKDEFTKSIGESYIVVAKMIKYLSEQQNEFLTNEKKYEKYHFQAIQFCEKTGDIAYEFKTIFMQNVSAEKNSVLRFYINENIKEILSTYTPKNIKEIIIDHLNTL